MASEREKQLHKAVVKVLSYKRVHMCELTTKRGSQMLYNELTRLGFRILSPAEPEWSFIKVFQVMFQDQNHMPDKVKIDPQLVLDVLAFCYVERIRILSEEGVNYCELAVLRGGEQVIYDKETGKRPKTLKMALFTIFSPPIYNESSVEELEDVILNKAFQKIPYRFEPFPSHFPDLLRQTLKTLKEYFPTLADYKDLIECVDMFLRLLGRQGIRIIREKEK